MTTTNTTRFAVFGDIHGRIALMMTLAALYERHSGHRLNAILQVGDMGAFPDHQRLDSATRSHAKRDADELAFRDFAFPSEEGQRYLDSENTPEVFFIRGNHEDFEYLDRFKHVCAVDPWQRLLFIPDGQTIAIDGVCVAGFGGIAPRSLEEREQRRRGKKARKERRRAVQKNARDPRLYKEGPVEKAFFDTGAIDILLTHDGPRCADFPHGSASQAQLVERIKPRVHCFGHHHVVVHGTGPGESLLVGLEHLDWERRGGQLRDASWGILELSPDRAEFTFATRQLWPWLVPLTQHSYRHEELGW